MRAPLASFVLVLSACAPALENPAVVRDSTGLTFGWSCAEDSLCELTSVPELDFPLPPCDGAGWGRSWGRFYELCLVCPVSDGTGWSTLPQDCRPLACDVDQDCPQVASDERIDRYECVDGLCQNDDLARHPRDVLRVTDADVLCFAPVPRSETATFDAAAAVVRREALDEACPFDAETCELPAACAWP